MQQVFTYQLENIAVGAAMAYSLAGLLGLGVLAGLSYQGAQLLYVGSWVDVDPPAHGIVIGNQAVAPLFGGV